MQGVEHIDGALSHVERVKAHRGEGWADKFADGEIIGANESHVLWQVYAETGKRTEQDPRVLIAKGIDSCGTMRTQEGGLDQGKSGGGREGEGQGIQGHPRFLRDGCTHPFQALQERFFLYRIIWMHEGKMVMTARNEVLGCKISQCLAGKDDGIGLLNRFSAEPDKDDMIDPHLPGKSDIFSREVEGIGDDTDRATSKDRLMQVPSLLS